MSAAVADQTPTVPQLTAAVKAMLHGGDSNGELLPGWIDLIRSALRKARSEVNSILAGRGYTLEQITGGDEYAATVEFQTLFWCGILNAGLLTTDVYSSLKELDQRKYLMAMPWTIAGAIVVPGATGVVQSASGGFAYPATGTARNPLLTDPVPRRFGDVPFPSY